MNTRKEFEKHIAEHTAEVFCAQIRYAPDYGDEKKYSLKQEHTTAEYDAFLNSLDFEYDNGYGGQELFGTIWYVDGTWSERREYDGSEWWEHCECPRIPKELEA